jgi:sugar/nucleoside kinase (ribokinase family)
MTVLVVGSVALDTVTTPFGARERALGGSATYFSMASRLLTDVRLVAVVGGDFPDESTKLLEASGVDTQGLQVVKSGRTFHWKGEYGANLNEAITLDTQLNVFAEFDPVLPENYRKSETVFLANIHPEIQAKVLNQVKDPGLVALDTMNFWIKSERNSLLKVLERIHVLTVNEGEARLLSGEHNIVKAARAIRRMGPRTIVIKRGEYGALYFGEDEIFHVPGYPLEEVFDPTGAGDTFAGGMIGYLDRVGGASSRHVRQAMVVGCVLASFTVEAFSVDRLKGVSIAEMHERFQRFQNLTVFDDLDIG